MTRARRRLSSPIRWVGGKAKTQAQICHVLDDVGARCYLEPFLGGASILLGKRRHPVEAVSDTNGEIVNFFRVLRGDPGGLFRRLRLEEASRARFDELRGMLPAEVEALSPLDRAVRFYVLIRLAYGGLWRESSSGRMNAPFAADPTRSPPNLPDPAEVEALVDRLDGVWIERGDWRELLGGKWAREDALAYLDPPYYPDRPERFVGYRAGGFGAEDHVELADRLDTFPGRWALSINDCDEVRGLYVDDRRTPRWVIPVGSVYAIGAMTEGDRGLDVLILNWNPEAP